MNAPESLSASYEARAVAGGEYELSFSMKNGSSVMANAAFFLSPQTLKVQPGVHYELKAEMELASSDQRAEVGIGYHLLGAQGRYLTEYVPGSARAFWRLPGPQPLVADYALPITPGPDSRAVQAIAPRLSIINLAPGASLSARMRWRPVQLKAPLLLRPTLHALSVPELLGRPGQILRLKITGVGLGDGAAAAGLEAALVIRRADDKDAPAVSVTKPASGWKRQRLVADVWQLALPTDLAPGRYEILFGLKEGGARLKTLLAPAPGVRATSTSGLFQVGQLTVTGAATGMWIGASFHRYPGPSERRLGPVAMDYQFARSLSADGLGDMGWWQGEDKYRWSQLDAWAAFHARPGRGLLMVFSGSPTWASASPSQPSAMAIPGFAAPPAQRYWPAYGRMVYETVKRLKGKLLAVECWNEPDLVGGFTGTSTQLADLCKIVAGNARRVDPTIPVICPQPESPRGLPFVYGAKTSQGEAIEQFCDYVGSHVYGAMGEDRQGEPLGSTSIETVMRTIRSMNKRYGIAKPIAVTEYGIAGCATGSSASHPVPFGHMESAEAGEALYQSIGAFGQEGVALLGLYSYDHGDNNPRCRPGGSFLRTMELDRSGAQRPNPIVLEDINRAVRDFGRH